MATYSHFDLERYLSYVKHLKNDNVSIAKQYYEDELKFDVPFSNESKDSLKKRMIDLIRLEREVRSEMNVETQLQSQLLQLSRSFSSEENTINQVLSEANLDENYLSVLQQIQQVHMIVPENDDSYRALLKYVEVQEQNDEEVEMLESDFTIPNDPYTGRPIEVPIRNKKCNHLYCKIGFEESFGNKNWVKCPIRGCTNSKVAINDVEEDSEMKLKIVKAKSKL